jgi:hypothetical protein
MPEAREWFLLVDFTGSLKFPNDGGADESKFCIELYAPSGYSGRLVLSFGSCRGVFGSPWAGDAASAVPYPKDTYNCGDEDARQTLLM